MITFPEGISRFINKKHLYSKDEAIVWLLFLVAPVLPFIVAIKNFRYNNLRKFIVIFGGLYGFFFVAIPDSDATSYQFHFHKLGNYSFGSLKIG